jgi:hypothetical protein
MVEASAEGIPAAFAIEANRGPVAPMQMIALQV